MATINEPLLKVSDQANFVDVAYMNWPSLTQTGVSTEHKFEITQRDELLSKVFELEEKVRRIEVEKVGFIKINFLATKRLSIPLDIIVEPDDGAFIARTTDIPLYGYGDDVMEAVEALKYEIESLYNDLTEDDSFSEDWLKIRDFLRERII
jgi:hypothetical protein